MGIRNIPTNEVLAASTRNDPGHFAGDRFLRDGTAASPKANLLGV
jgi:hypothetical protein